MRLVVPCSLVCVYFAAYAALLDEPKVDGALIQHMGFHPFPGGWHHGSTLLHFSFAPANWLDRRLRPGAWDLWALSRKAGYPPPCERCYGRPRTPAEVR